MGLSITGPFTRLLCQLVLEAKTACGGQTHPQINTVHGKDSKFNLNLMIETHEEKIAQVPSSNASKSAASVQGRELSLYSQTV